MSHKLLLADDSVTIQRVIELTFADEDVTVAAVGDGEQAIAQIDADPPDIVLADVGMPKRDGYEVAAYVKGQPELAHIPVVLLTGAFEPVDPARAKAAGCDGVLAKPFEPQMVINRVKELLGVETTPIRKRAVSTRAVRPVEPPTQEPEPPERPAAAAAVSPAAPEPRLPVLDPSNPDASLDEYFDQLDAAFAALEEADTTSQPGANLHVVHPAPAVSEPDDVGAIDWSMPEVAEGAAGEEPAPPAPSPGPPPAPRRAPAGDMDFYDVVGIEEQRPEPAVSAGESSDAAVGALEPPSSGAQAGPSPVAVPTPAPAPAPAAAPPPIADAFTALFDAEQDGGDVTAVVSGGTPVAGPGPVGAPAALPGETEALVQEICRRVLARLTEQVIRQATAEIIPRIADRLVREELANIREGK